jgi:hypothetical protein
MVKFKIKNLKRKRLYDKERYEKIKEESKKYILSI